jgi:hypothetical protein
MKLPERVWKVLANILYTGANNPKMWAILLSAGSGFVGYTAHTIRVEDIANALSILSTLAIPALPDKFKKQD